MNEQILLQLHRRENSLNTKKWVITIFTVMLCFIDEIKGSAYGGVTQVAVNLIGFAIAAMILIHYHAKEFLKPVHLVWLIVFILGFFYFYDPVSITNHYLRGQWITAALNVLLFGHIAIATFCHYLSKRMFPKMRWIFFVPWLIMMLGMVFSRSDFLWPLWFLCIFTCLYFTEFSSEERDCIFDGLSNGIILAFFLIQGFATCYRMYDSLRYQGMYTNSNINALSYLIVEAALLAKWYRCVLLNKKFIYRFTICVGVGILISYCMLTVGRTAFAVTLLNFVSVLFLLLFVDKKYRLSKITIRFAGVILAAIYSFPLVFCSVRYTPAKLASPLLLGYQESAPIMIQNFSEDHKSFVPVETLIEYFLYRVEKTDFRELYDFLKERQQSFNPLFSALPVKAAASEEPSASPASLGSGESSEDPMYSHYSQTSPFDIRIDIYKGYFRRLNYSGHKKDELPLWITDKVVFPHCHNLLLQMLYNFGWIPGILFGCIGLISILFYFFTCIFSRDPGRRNLLCCMIFILSFFGFGMFELDWELGQMPLTLFFISCYCLFHKGNAADTQAED